MEPLRAAAPRSNTCIFVPDPYTLPGLDISFRETVVHLMREPRNHTRSGCPIGTESFIVKMERKLDRIFKVRPRGRPKKGKKE